MAKKKNNLVLNFMAAASLCSIAGTSAYLGFYEPPEQAKEAQQLLPTVDSGQYFAPFKDIYGCAAEDIQAQDHICTDLRRLDDILINEEDREKAFWRLNDFSQSFEPDANYIVWQTERLNEALDTILGDATLMSRIEGFPELQEEDKRLLLQQISDDLRGAFYKLPPINVVLKDDLPDGYYARYSQGKMNIEIDSEKLGNVWEMIYAVAHETKHSIDSEIADFYLMGAIQDQRLSGHVTATFINNAAYAQPYPARFPTMVSRARNERVQNQYIERTAHEFAQTVQNRLQQEYNQLHPANHFGMTWLPKQP